MAVSLRRQAWETLIRVLRSRFDFVYVARSGLAHGLRRRGGLGFLPGRPLTSEERWLANQSWAGKVVYDVGAWEGVLTLFLARATGAQGQVIAFEPNPRNVARLRENIALNHLNNVRLLEIALGDDEGQVGLHIPENNTARGHLDPTATGVTASVKRLDTLIVEAKLPPPDFVKIDVEGAELAVLRGAQVTLARCRPELLIEVHPEADYARLLTLLSTLGYSDIRCLETRRALTSPANLPDTRGVWHWVARAGNAQ